MRPFSIIRAATLLLLLCLGCTTNLYAQQQPVAKEGQTLTNQIGMEFIRIAPGSMRVGRVELECPAPPDSREVAESVHWTEADYQRCEELVRRHNSPGFL
ncbi:MAG: hypothetical protein KY428_12475, partial [Bacteroidetes bacterium]|nr:hypothetical protein [Bacteroidota bacterium]